MLRAFVELAESHGQFSSGHHNRNYVLPLTADVAALVGREPGTSVTVRIRRTEALPVVIRTWQDEAQVLNAIRGVLPHAPECLVKEDRFSLHSYVEGVPLSTASANGKPVGTVFIEALAGLLAQMTQVRRTSLPSLPAALPHNDKDSQDFLRALARLADQQIRQANWAQFGGLFAALGIPEDALQRFGERVPAMARRPFSLLHADLHRDNVIMSYGGDPPLICVDWELASYGDPLHDLATHLVRMQYPAHQWDEMKHAWAGAMLKVRPAAVAGVAKDLRHYVGFEYAQSVYPDVIRAAQSLQASFDAKSLATATTTVRRALEAAAEPLCLRRIPGDREIERALVRGCGPEGGTRGGRGRTAHAFAWQPDPRVPEHPDFPSGAVLQALAAERTVPARLVFKGATHLNSVVTVEGIRFPVVVRRRLPDVHRPERRYLSEYAVLRLIEDSGAAVAAPRLLALGRSHEQEDFAIHTFAGPDIRRPNHPTRGLLPLEADALVDQLCALTDVEVDGAQVDPDFEAKHFYRWLHRELVSQVRDLPKESLQLAHSLGLPTVRRLAHILDRHVVAPRRPVLLHGDLSPWNLVRHGDSQGLTLIDWELAMIGDPLYDLVRHLHLTPAKPAIRERMFLRWKQRMPADCTVNWEQDWHAYRWLETVRSAYLDLDRLYTGEGQDAPDVQRARDQYTATLEMALGILGVKHRPLTLDP